MKCLIVAAAVALGLAGCSQADFARNTNYGSSGRVTCYSGGRVISDDYSTGRIESEAHSDGWYYVSAADSELKHVSGQCVLQQRAGLAPSGFLPVYPR
jgi:hypothetical protein